MPAPPTGHSEWWSSSSSNDFDESLYDHRVRNGVHHLHPRLDGGFDLQLTPLPPPGLVERIARSSALALYLVRNVGLSQAIANMGDSRARAEAPARYIGNTLADASAARIAEGEKVDCLVS